MNKSIAHIKTSFPEAAILMLGVGDRSYKTEEGELKTMPGVKNPIQYQKVIAPESSVVFGICFRPWVGKVLWSKWYMLNLLWPITIIRTSIFEAANIWQVYYMNP